MKRTIFGYPDGAVPNIAVLSCIAALYLVGWTLILSERVLPGAFGAAILAYAMFASGLLMHELMHSC